MDDDFEIMAGHLLGARSDEQLVAYARAAHAHGSSAAVADAFEQLVFRHQRRLRYLLRKVPDDLLDELSQDVLMDAFEAVIGDREIDHFSGWLAQVARNRVADFWRGKQGRQLQVDRSAAADDDDGRHALRGVPTVEGDFGEADSWMIIDGLLAEMRPSHRRIVELSIFADRPGAEVVAETGETANNVYKVRERFRADLRRALDNHDPGSGREDRI